ncbi:MAG: sialidase family protein [Acidobacteriaceae bacterium]
MSVKSWMCGCLLALMAARCGAQRPVKPATLPAAAELHLRSELIFAPGSASFQQCHASTVVELKNGDLLAAWFGGEHEGAADVAIWTARYSKGSWSAPVETAREKGVPLWNPVLFHTLDGRLWLYYKAGPNPGTWSGVRSFSSDEGRTWSAPERMPAGLIGPVRAKPLVMTDGTIVAGASVEAYKTWAAWVERSVDGGATWKSIGPIDVTEEQDKAETPAPEPAADSQNMAGLGPEWHTPREFLGIIQPSVVSLGGSRLRLYARSRTLAAKIVVADSTDAGRSWGPTHFLDVPNNNSGLDALGLRDGRVVLLCNNVSRGRSPLTLLISSDGEHFRPFATLEQGPGEFSYPALIQRRDGDLEMTYTWKRESIKHVHVPLQDVPR